MTHRIWRGRRALLAVLGLATLTGACLSDPPPGTAPSEAPRAPGADDESGLSSTTHQAHPGDTPEVSAPEERHSCIPHRERALEVSWEGNASGGEALLSDTHVTWRIMNASAEALAVVPTATLDTGSLRTRHIPLPKLDLPSGHEVTVAVDLSEHVPNLNELRFSGMVMLTAQAERGGATTVGEPRFFHADDKGLHVYDERTMARRYHHGDYRHRVTDDPDEGVVTTRIVSATDVIHTVDDELEDEVIEGSGVTP